MARKKSQNKQDTTAEVDAPIEETKETNSDTESEELNTSVTEPVPAQETDTQSPAISKNTINNDISTAEEKRTQTDINAISEYLNRYLKNICEENDEAAMTSFVNALNIIFRKPDPKYLDVVIKFYKENPTFLFDKRKALRHVDHLNNKLTRMRVEIIVGLLFVYFKTPEKKKDIRFDSVREYISNDEVTTYFINLFR